MGQFFFYQSMDNRRKLYLKIYIKKLLNKIYGSVYLENWTHLFKYTLTIKKRDIKRKGEK